MDKQSVRIEQLCSSQLLIPAAAIASASEFLELRF
jgi:hypothetical protein